MKLKWSGEYIKGFAKKVSTAERQHGFWRLTDCLPILVIVTCVVAIIWMWVKIYQLWVIKAWLELF